jgi:hypothetical protein
LHHRIQEDYKLGPKEQLRQQQGQKLLALFWMERIYVIDDESSKTTDEVEVYDPQTDS